MSTRAIKTVEINGGLDKFLLSTDGTKLSKQALAVKKQLVSKLKKSA